MSFFGSTAIVTGGASGIGLAISERLADDGAKVAILDVDGTLVDTGGLLPSKDGARVRLANGKITVTDGPFSESKEVIGGLFFLRASDLDEAIRWASASRFLAHGALEIRELWRM